MTFSLSSAVTHAANWDSPDHVRNVATQGRGDVGVNCVRDHARLG